MNINSQRLRTNPIISTKLASSEQLIFVLFYTPHPHPFCYLNKNNCFIKFPTTIIDNQSQMYVFFVRKTRFQLPICRNYKRTSKSKFAPKFAL